jgi:hypothetical protein
MRTLTLITTLGLTLLSSALVAQNVSYDYDKATNFSQFKTYSWVRGTTLSDELNHRRVVNAIDEEFARRGFTKVEMAGGADVLVAYHASFDKDIEINGFSSGWGPYRFGGSRTGSARVDEILTGTLAVDVVNRRTNLIVWRGTASKEVNVNAKPETRERNINKAVEKLFNRFPVPAPKS